MNSVRAPGGSEAIPPTWCSSDKDFVTTSLGRSRLWATFGHGVVNEVYWPSTGEPELRDLTLYLLPTEAGGSWIDLKRARHYTITAESPSIPLAIITHTGDDYTVEIEPLPDPRRDVLLLRFRVDGPYRLALIAAPHLGGTGYDNIAEVHDTGMYAVHGDRAMCITADVTLSERSVGIVGVSDGWQDLSQHGRLTWNYEVAGPGNVAMTAAVDAPSGLIAVSFSNTSIGARTLARSSVAEGFDVAKRQFIARWRDWAATLTLGTVDEEFREMAVRSAAVLKIHEDRTYPGATAASLSVPWGNTSDSAGGYHLVWPRDAALSALGLVAAGQLDEVRHILARFVACQLSDGRWAQNEYPSGIAYWHAVQLDEVAFPVVLAAKYAEVTGTSVYGVPAMVSKALTYLAGHGPSSGQDRWEENPGINPFTVAVMVAALVAGSRWLTAEERAEAELLADEWNERVDQWCYTTDSPYTTSLDVAGHYVRVTVPAEGGIGGQIMIRNRDGEMIEANSHIALEFGYLVRFGLRSMSDQKIIDSITVADHVLVSNTPIGPVYHRYNNDGYGEAADGSPFTTSGIGRAWPLLSGERGHLEVLAGRDPGAYLRVMQRSASAGGMIPEQVWDTDPIPSRELWPGRPSGSAMPLAWAHAEFIKLATAAPGRCVEQLESVVRRYATARPAPRWSWRSDTPIEVLPPGKVLLIEAPEPFTLHAAWNDWSEPFEVEASAIPLGRYGVTFDVAELTGHRSLYFTRRFAQGWEGVDHSVTVG